jgi:hypothetical protein
VKIGALAGKATTIKTEALILGIFEGEAKLPDEVAAFDQASGGVVSEMITGGTGKT